MDHGQEQDLSVLMRTAVRQVDRLNRAVNRYRILVIILAAVCVALIGGGAILGITYSNTQDLVHRTQDLVHRTQDLVHRQSEQAYNGCLAGNAFRSGNDQIWHFFIEVATKGNPNANTRQSKEIVRQLLDYVDKVETPRNCKPLSGG